MSSHEKQSSTARLAWAMRLRTGLAYCAASTGAAIAAIGVSLVAMSMIVLALGAGSASGVALTGHPLHVAVEDGAVGFYLAQLVSVTFFHHTAGLRFAVLPGLGLVGVAIATSAMMTAKLIGGSARKRMLVAMLVPIPFALLSGLGALYLPLHFTGPGIGRDTAVLPVASQAFLLPLVWSLLFASVGGLLGVFGRRWRYGASRTLGAWATPLRCSLRALVLGLALTSVVVIVGGVIVAGQHDHAGSIVDGSFGHVLAVVAGALIALPTLVISVFLACFGVSYDWRVEALTSTQGSGSIVGGTLPSIGTSSSHSISGALVLLLLLAAVTVLSAGWLTARRSGENARLSMINALRAGVLMTMACWLFGLISRVDAQAGGYLGLHVEANSASLLWRVPLWCFLGSIIGSAAYLATRGAPARRQLLAALVAGIRSVIRPQALRGSLHTWRQGLATRSALGLGFLSLPAMLIGIGAASAITVSHSATVSLAPISQAAEQTLRHDAVPGSRLSVTVDPATRVIDAASIHIPLSALAVSAGQSPTVKAKAVLAHYGTLFGMSGQHNEVATPEVLTDPITKAKSHVYFKQMADGLPVYGNSIGVHLSPNGKSVDFVNGSFIPDVSVANATAAISSAHAASLAKAFLPNSALVHPPRLEVYAGLPSHPSGPTARLAWFVWLSTGPLNASNEYVVDATTGNILHTFGKSFNLTTPSREVYTGEHTTKGLPGKLLRKEGEGPKGDADTDHAYEYLGTAFLFYKSKTEPAWLGYNETGEKPEIATVHYGLEFKKAEWYAAGQEIIFGDGYPAALDVVGHEYAGGITEHSAEENGEGQSGAVAEGFADSMGEALENYATKAEPDWLAGALLPGGAVRNLKTPKESKEGADPEKLSEYITTCKDSKGIHQNSTILSHAFYLLSKKITVPKAARIFARMQTFGLRGIRGATLEQARNAAIEAAIELYNEGSLEALDTGAVFEAAGLNGVAVPPEGKPEECTPQCTFTNALQAQEPAHGTVSTLEMLATLYRARGVLAQPSAAGQYFLPIYEQNMGRITELVSGDPTLEEMAVGGLQQIAPALNALTEGEGRKVKLSASEMAQIEASLKRLAQDDRLFSGGGTLAKLIERELKWLRLPSYAGLTYEKGFKRLNKEVVIFSEKAPPPTISIVDPSCSETPYHNEFQINDFSVDTPGHYKPGEVSPLVSSGVACGTSVEVSGSRTECKDSAGPLNTELSLELPPGDKVNSTKELEEGAFIGKTTGRVVACAGTESKMIYGATAITAIKSWTVEKCPTAAIACYKVHAIYESGELKGEGHGYAWVTEEASRLTLTTGPVKDTIENSKGSMENVPVGFSQFAVELCARAGKAGGSTCGTSASPWVHKNGEESQPGCSTENGRYVARVTNRAKEATVPAEHCVYWGEYAHKQTIDTGNSLKAVSCVPGTTECVATDSKGNALYSTTVSATATATWKVWTGPASPGEAVACPTSSLCTLAYGKVGEGIGGNVYYATSLGGTVKEAFKPANGALAISCPSSTFCVDGQEAGSISYSTSPGSTSWTEVTSIGSSAINGVSCLSSSFCAAVNGVGDVYVANSEAHIKEAAGWKLTDVDGSTALHGIACTSTTSCVAVDSVGDVIGLTINGSGEATAAKRNIDGTNNMTAVACAEGICVAVDSKGNVFVSSSNGAKWNNQHALATNLTSVSCASRTLCVAADTSGHVTAFVPAAVPPSYTKTIDSGNTLKSVSCIQGLPECVATDSKGNALYATLVSATASATWKSWSGPASPSEAVSCPASSLCVVADGQVEEGIGGNAYYATSLGGTWKEAFSPTFGVLAVSCPTTSFCVATQESLGDIRYATKPASTEWTAVSIGTGAMNAVDCLSSSFCAVVDAVGHVHIATTAAKIKETAGWKSTDIDGTSPLHGIACASTTSCVAIDETGNVFELTINSSGEATAVTEDIDGTNKLTAVTCTEGITCVAVDSIGNVFVSDTSGETWQNEQALGTDLTSVSCSANTLCVATNTKGEAAAFEAR
jgi:Zn-dependent metalloprotease